MDTFLIRHNGRQFGPCSLLDVNYYIAIGTFDSSAQLWQQGWPQWRSAGSVLDELMPAVDGEELAKDMCNELKALLAKGTKSDEVRKLEWRYAIRGLRDVLGVRIQMYRVCAQQVHYDGDAAPELLGDIAELLQVPKMEVECAHADLVIADWEEGLLPVVSPPPVPLQQREVVHFDFTDVHYLQERTVCRRWYGGPSASFRVARGVYVRTGSLGGMSWSESDVVNVGMGNLVVTSKRIIFSSPKASFGLPMSKLLNVTGFCDGLVVVKDSSAAANKPFFFRNKTAQRLINAAVEVLWERNKQGEV